ncbi:MAG: hypothetical protein QG657_5347 [Acidobacteriota bacterium]|nr:hypothetical protein [Acidobacteriota bacterium]
MVNLEKYPVFCYIDFMKTLKKRKLVDTIDPLLKDDEIIVIHGSRQVGKTSLMKYLMQYNLKSHAPSQNIIYMDLEDFTLLNLCNAGVDNTVNYLKTIGCDFSQRIFLFIDEIQYLDNPSSFLKLFHDRYSPRIKLLVSGSSSFAIKSKFKDSLVGRIFSFELFGLDFEEFLWFKDTAHDLGQMVPEALYPVLREYYKEHVLYGSYPKLVLSDSIEKKELILKEIINTYVKKDIFELSNIKNIKKFNDLIVLLAGQGTGQLNLNELTNTLGLNRETLEKYLFILENTYIIKQVPPFSRNIRIELTRMPEVFMEDTGMMNLLANKTFIRELSGALFENSVFSLLRKNGSIENIFYWRTSQGHEVDFIYEPTQGKLFAMEVKLRFSKQSMTAVNYFKQQYPSARTFVITLDKISKPPEGIDALYPWELYGRLFRNRNDE